jgi:hypothetical protein
MPNLEAAHRGAYQVSFRYFPKAENRPLDAPQFNPFVQVYHSFPKFSRELVLFNNTSLIVNIWCFESKSVGGHTKKARQQSTIFVTLSMEKFGLMALDVKFHQSQFGLDLESFRSDFAFFSCNRRRCEDLVGFVAIRTLTGFKAAKTKFRILVRQVCILLG